MDLLFYGNGDIFESTTLTCNDGNTKVDIDIDTFQGTDCWITQSPTKEPTIVPTSQSSKNPTTHEPNCKPNNPNK